MSRGRYFWETDPNGIRRWVEIDEHEIRETIVDDVEDVIEDNKRLYNQDDGYSISGDLRRSASIPLALYLKWKNELGIDAINDDHAQAVKKLLNSNEYRFLRTAAGRL